MHVLTALGGAVLLSATTAPAGEIDPALGDILQNQAAPDEVISTIVYLVDQADLGEVLETDGPMSHELRNTTSIQALRGMIEFAKQKLLRHDR